MNLTLETGLTAQFPTLEDVCVAAVYGSRGGLGAVAAHLDMSPSELSRRLNRNPDDPRNLRANHLDAIVEATGDLRPIHWLIEKHMRTADDRRQQALDRLADLAPEIARLLAEAKR